MVKKVGEMWEGIKRGIERGRIGGKRDPQPA